MQWSLTHETCFEPTPIPGSLGRNCRTACQRRTPGRRIQDKTQEGLDRQSGRKDALGVEGGRVRRHGDRQMDETPEDVAKGRKLAESPPMEIHSVLYGWANFNSEKAESVTGELAKVDRALKAARLRANALPLVPCRLTRSVKVPQPREFDIELDEKTSYVRQGRPGRQLPYAEYIAEQNRATDASRKAVEALIPVAEKTGVIIAGERLEPVLGQAESVRQFRRLFRQPVRQGLFRHRQSRQVREAGGVVRGLGQTDRQAARQGFQGRQGGETRGEFVDIRDGDVNWPAVRQHIERIGYNDYMTIEGSGGSSLERTQESVVRPDHCR